MVSALKARLQIIVELLGVKGGDDHLASYLRPFPNSW